MYQRIYGYDYTTTRMHSGDWAGLVSRGWFTVYVDGGIATMARERR